MRATFDSSRPRRSVGAHSASDCCVGAALREAAGATSRTRAHVSSTGSDWAAAIGAASARRRKRDEGRFLFARGGRPEALLGPVLGPCVGFAAGPATAAPPPRPRVRSVGATSPGGLSPSPRRPNDDGRLMAATAVVATPTTVVVRIDGGGGDGIGGAAASGGVVSFEV